MWCDGDAGDLEAVGERSDVVPGRHFDEHFAQAQGVLAGAGAAAVPDVHGHVVVVAAGGDEQRLAVPACGLLEAEGADVEVVGRLDVAHLQVDVADAGVGAALARPPDSSVRCCCR